MVRTLPSKSHGAFQALRMFSSLSRPYILVPLTLVSLYRHPVFAYAGCSAWSACSPLCLLKAFSFRRCLLGIYSVPDCELGPGDTKMSKAGPSSASNALP